MWVSLLYEIHLAACNEALAESRKDPSSPFASRLEYLSCL